MKLDIEEIRQSPRSFVDLETVIALSDRVMALEIKLLEAESQWRICDVTVTVRETERDEFAAQNAAMRDALENHAGNYKLTKSECAEMAKVLALPDHSADILRKRDAETLRKAATWFELRRWGDVVSDLKRMADERELGK